MVPVFCIASIKWTRVKNRIACPLSVTQELYVTFRSTAFCCFATPAIELLGQEQTISCFENIQVTVCTVGHLDKALVRYQSCRAPRATEGAILLLIWFSGHRSAHQNNHNPKIPPYASTTDGKHSTGSIDEDCCRLRSSFDFISAEVLGSSINS